MRKPKFDLWGGIQALQIAGRDEFYTHLLMQEVPFWLQGIYAGNAISEHEVRELIRVRGFHGGEATQFRRLAEWLNENAKSIRATRPAASKQVAFLEGWEAGSKACAPKVCPNQDPHIKAGYRAAKAALRKTAKAYAAKIGFKEE